MGATLTRAISAPGTGGGAGGSRVYGEVPGGAIPGTGSFTTSVDFVAGSETLYLNGVRQFEGATCDYTRSESGGVGTGFDTVTFAFSLHASDTILIDYTPA